MTGEVYRGRLVEAEDNMNCQMQGVNVTYRDGRVAQLENIYLRGSKIRYSSRITFGRKLSTCRYLADF